MAIEMCRPSRTSAAAEFLGNLSVGRAAQSVSFQEQMAEATDQARPTAALTNQPGNVQASQQDGARQILGATAITAARETGSKAAVARGETQQAAPDTPVETLRQALRLAGMDPERFSFTEVRELVSYPGGAYVNHQVLFEAGAAREYYDVALMLRNPEVTVTEIRRLLSLSAAPVTT